MKVEIWSDIMCPFCYIGKKNFERALNSLPEKETIEVEWKSFQLDPEISADQTFASEVEYLAERKSMSPERVKEMFEHVTQVGKEAGIAFDFDKTIVANTHKAHRLLHFAKSFGLSNVLKERLFNAHFTDGLHINDDAVLLQLAQEIGMDVEKSKAVLEQDEYAYEVNQDIQEAQNIGVRGVPFFVFDRKYAISGAQPEEAFLETLQKSVSEWNQSKTPTIVSEATDGASCTPDQGCQ